ncbi:hypothetical protein P171DRAFT_473980 [Karstenula rhodostoma CBS 690.94]|uniref:Uncharacterized protein n=1 Tax=Karstenula rhodostoma CBS 690.94 TaxID=1392251 RepID=A0A9P4UB29_9PLEO|nr:hypothetical protein P171DRAFT_473980 [Karstenula rhodostoma CBS 690.94]
MAQRGNPPPPTPFANPAASAAAQGVPTPFQATPAAPAAPFPAAPVALFQPAPAASRAPPSPFDHRAVEAYMVTMGNTKASQFCLNCGQHADAEHRANHAHCTGTCWRCGRPGTAHGGLVCPTWDGAQSQSWWQRRLDVPRRVMFSWQETGILQNIQFAAPPLPPVNRGQSLASLRDSSRSQSTVRQSRGRQPPQQVAQQSITSMAPPPLPQPAPSSGRSRGHGRGSTMGNSQTVQSGRINKDRSRIPQNSYATRFDYGGYMQQQQQQQQQQQLQLQQQQLQLQQQRQQQQLTVLATMLAASQDGSNGVARTPGPPALTHADPARGFTSADPALGPYGVVSTPGPLALTHADPARGSTGADPALGPYGVASTPKP